MGHSRNSWDYDDEWSDEGSHYGHKKDNRHRKYRRKCNNSESLGRSSLHGDFCFNPWGRSKDKKNNNKSRKFKQW